ncbi:sarcosine oxidase subunit gamma [Paracoccus halophilus]|uniref:Sarcosine oxidase subunit gamma n=1 Tax=Paracoccus halophilus TaxID=376733 RepID=A0A099EXE8_9RHOB|nr:hypothetical protein [Paracoccus halophilus]KGJ02648.1 hypothetical protein IT41_16940 [Paracoccus halophilus]SFA60518.1 sarcosine oxidase subunit gamma [Paracoccus halophilus]
MTALAAPARSWPLDHRLPLLKGWPTDDRNRMLDLSPLPRLGLRGPGTSAWLAGQGCPLPETIHRSAGTEGMTILRLGAEEVVILSDPLADPDRLTRLQQDWQATTGPKGFDAYRDEGWCWLCLSGPAISDALPLLTAIDTRPNAFGLGTVVQTRALHMDAVLVRTDRGGVPSVDILFDVASSGFAADFIADVLPGFEMGRLVR